MSQDPEVGPPIDDTLQHEEGANGAEEALFDERNMDDEERDLILNVGTLNTHPLNNRRLYKAMQRIFLGDKFLTPERYRAIVEGNYTGLNLGEHGNPYQIQDFRSLLYAFAHASANLESTTKERTNAILIAGCGSGRLAVPTVELAKKYGFQKVVHLDLLQDHVDQTEALLREVYAHDRTALDGVELEFITGDLINKAEEIHASARAQFDMVFATWFVTPEIADFSSSENLKKSRVRLYKAIANVLSKRGIFVEDIPDVDQPGRFYNIGKVKTEHLLGHKDILPGLNRHMLLSNFQRGTGGTEQFPYHLRFTPTKRYHEIELRRAGLVHHGQARTVTQPIGVRPGMNTTEFNNGERMHALIARNSIPDIDDELERREKSLTIPPRNPEEAQVKRVALFQKASLGKKRNKRSRSGSSATTS